MSEALIQQIADAIIDGLFAQSTVHSTLPDAPVVWQGSDEQFIHIDGAIDVLALAKDVAQAI
jgi:hypothetical protein